MRDTYHHGNVRRAVLEAAALRLAGEPNQDLSLRDLAADVGTSHVAIYRHFRSKRDVLAELGTEGFLDFVARMEAHLAQAAEFRTPREALINLAYGYVAFAQARTGHFRAMFHKETHPRCEFPLLLSAATGAFGLLLRTADAFLREADPVATLQKANMLWGQVHGIAVLALDEQLGGPFGAADLDPARLAAQAVGIWCDGIEATRSGPSAEPRS